MCYRKGALIRASGAERSGSQNLQAVLQTSKQKPRLTFLHSFCLRRRCSPTRSGWRATRSPRRVSCGLFAFRMRNGSIGLLRFWCLQRSAAAEPNPALLTPGTGLCPGGGAGFGPVGLCWSGFLLLQEDVAERLLHQEAVFMLLHGSNPQTCNFSSSSFISG